MDLDNYIKVKYDNKVDWFINAVGEYDNVTRINNVIDNKDYLNGDHKVNRLPNFEHNGKTIEPRRIVLNLAKQIINWQISYLLKNDVQVVGVESVAEQFNRVNKAGRYSQTNNKVLELLLKHGMCAEYVYLHDGKIQSRVLDPSEFTPVFNHHNQLLSVIESHLHDGITYWTVYKGDTVESWSNEGGSLHLVESAPTLSGLPVLYMADGEYSNEPYSDLDAWKNIIDEQELILSRYTDSLYTYLDPVQIVFGQPLKGSLNKSIPGQALNLDSDADFKSVGINLDYKSYDTLYKSLSDNLLTVSGIPSVGLGKADISNLSEISIRMLFSASDVKAQVYENFLKRGMYQRADKQKALLEMQGVSMSDDDYYSIDFQFEYNVPANHKEIIDNIATLKSLGGISTESILEKNPYVKDMVMEKERLIDEGIVTKKQLD